MTNFQPIVEETQQALRDDPALASASFAVASRQIEGLCSEVTARDFKLTVDEPEILGGTDRGPNPVELVLAALASCQEITYRLYADSLGIPLDGVSVKVTGDLDLRGLFAVDKSVRPGFGSNPKPIMPSFRSSAMWRQCVSRKSSEKNTSASGP